MGSFKFQNLFKIFNNLIYNNEVNFLFVILCASLLFVSTVTKSTQFPLHIWLLDAMERPTLILALMRAVIRPDHGSGHPARPEGLPEMWESLSKNIGLKNGSGQKNKTRLKNRLGLE